MSSRSRRTTTTTVSKETSSGGSQTQQKSQTTTPQGRPQSPASPGRRPPSPTMISRVQEKQELAGLNDRLANYIDKVRSLELENQRLTRQVQTQEETVHREVTNIRALYENELSEARKLLDETATQKAKLQIESTKNKKEAEDYKERFVQLEREHSQVQKRLLVAESQVNDLQAKLNDALAQRKHWEDEYWKIKKEHDGLLKKYDHCKKQLEIETVARVDLENRFQTIKDEQLFRDQIHEQELNETISRTRVEVEEVDGKLRGEYDNKLADALRDMRNQSETTIRMTREETEDMMSEKLATLRRMAEKKDGDATQMSEELRTYRKRVDESLSELTKLRSQNANLEGRVSDLERQLAREQEDGDRKIKQRDADLRQLREELETQMSEYRDLLDVKIQLDLELAAYSKMLEGEESRLNISSATEATPGRATPRRTPIRQMTASGRKRKRAALEESALLGSSSGLTTVQESAASAGFSASSSAKGAIEIDETDTDGKYVKLLNTSEKDVNLGGWQLKHNAGDNETLYKFHRTVHIKPNSNITVWSSECNETHAPPSTLVMKGQRWFTSDNMLTSLLNTSGEQMASREMKRSVKRTTYISTGGLDEPDGAEIQAPKECCIM